jgi:hypothetical protein
VLAMVLNERIQFGAAGIQNAGEVERNVGQMVRMCFAEFV